MSGPMIWHDEADRFATWGTLDPPDACMCTECVLAASDKADQCFKSGGWGSNPADIQTIDAMVKAIHWAP